MSGAKPPEVREVHGKLDEVVAKDCSFHLEQMDACRWWMAVEVGGKRVHIWLTSKARIKGSTIVEDA